MDRLVLELYEGQYEIQNLLLIQQDYTPFGVFGMDRNLKGYE
jgi:hypothetical protein